MTEKEVYKNGVALLKEWEDVNYCEHSFKFKDEWLTDKEVVDKLNELAEEKEICENEIARLEMIINTLKNKDYENYTKKIQELQDEHLAWKRVDVE